MSRLDSRARSDLTAIQPLRVQDRIRTADLRVWRVETSWAPVAPRGACYESNAEKRVRSQPNAGDHATRSAQPPQAHVRRHRGMAIATATHGAEGSLG
jgi:hypothetical protein